MNVHTPAGVRDYVDLMVRFGMPLPVALACNNLFARLGLKSLKLSQGSVLLRRLP